MCYAWFLSGYNYFNVVIEVACSNLINHKYS